VKIALILCGALAREIMALVERHGWQVSLHAVPAGDHLFPQRIAPKVERLLRQLIPTHDRVAVIYGDCGTYGALDAVLARFHVPRLTGLHCYEWFAEQKGAPGRFAQLMSAEPGTFFLTDFLVRSFEGTVLKGLGIDRHPELLPVYFGNYTRLLYLAQRDDAYLLAKAGQIAAQLGLPLTVEQNGYAGLETRLLELLATLPDDQFRPVLPDDPMESTGEPTDGKLPDHVLARHPGASAGERRARERAVARPFSRGG
jgi:hypothetical protein